MTKGKTCYSTIVIDPPWEISMTGKTKLRPTRPKKLPYKTMTLDEIKNFPINDFADIGCHVYMWTTNKMLRHTWDIFEKWGVNYHLTLPWVKTNGIAPCFAYKFASEFLILGFYGKPMKSFNKSCKLNWIQTKAAQKGNHSAKPSAWYELIKDMSPEPRIDIFARKRHEGFEAWGDEVEPYTQEVLVK